MPPDQKTYGIPYPGTFVLDRDGRVISRFFEEGYRTRMTGRALALRLDTHGDAGADSAFHVSDAQLDISIASSDPVVAPGQEFMVMIDVSLKPGVHAYAPGDHSYRALRFEPEPDSTFMIGPALYPKARDYHFKPLDEHVPVFEGEVRIMVPVVLLATRELSTRSREPGASVRLRGQLQYQACDDAVCYLPRSVPVTLTLGLRPLEK